MGDMDDMDDDGIGHIMMDELPSLDSSSDRQLWGEILAQQDDVTLEMNGMQWIKALVVRDEKDNMVVRFVYEDGREEIFDAQIRAELVMVNTPESERN